MAYDRADFDYSTEAEPLPPGHAATHIGIFLAWMVLHGLENEIHQQKFPALLEKLRHREITGREFFLAACGDKFSEKDLNPEGNAFAEWYYTDQAGQRGPYFADYRKLLAAGLPSFWHVEDTWSNYDRIAPAISGRFETWKNPKPKRWWQFWKR